MYCFNQSFKKRENFRASIRRKAIDQGMKARRKELTDQQLPTSSFSPSFSPSFSTLQEDSLISQQKQAKVRGEILFELEKAILNGKQEICKPCFINYLDELIEPWGHSGDDGGRQISEKIGTLLLNISASEQFWSQNFLKSFFAFLKKYFLEGLRIGFVLVNASECCYGLSKQLFYEGFIQSEISEFILNCVNDLEEMFRLMEIYKNFYLRSPTVNHKTQRTMEDTLLQIHKISKSFNKASESSIKNQILLTEMMNIFYAMMTRNRKSEKKMFLQKVIKFPHLFFEALQGYSENWNSKLKLRIILFLNEIFTGFPHQNNEIFYLSAQVISNIVRIQASTSKQFQIQNCFGNKIEENFYKLFLNLLSIQEKPNFIALQFFSSSLGVQMIQNSLSRCLQCSSGFNYSFNRTLANILQEICSHQNLSTIFDSHEFVSRVLDFIGDQLNEERVRPEIKLTTLKILKNLSDCEKISSAQINQKTIMRMLEKIQNDENEEIHGLASHLLKEIPLPFEL